MKKKTNLEEYLAEAGAVASEFNSNNPWGFGGAYGTKYELPNDGPVVRIATACYRHMDSTKIITISTDTGGRIFDEFNTPKARLAAIEVLKGLANAR
jgi:hypothetical protein